MLQRGKQVLFRYASVILAYINQGDEITAHPHLEHGVQIQSLYFGKDATELAKVQKKARRAESLSAQEGWSTLCFKTGKNRWYADTALYVFLYIKH